MFTGRQERINQIIKCSPLPLTKARTFFSIAGNNKSEIVISRWYGYYLDPGEDHGLGNIFIDTLMELAGNPFEIKQFSVHLEQNTLNGNFIDILVKGRGRDHGKYIIIENKIHHHVNNDLDDYWNHCISHESHKLGILLTLKPQSYKYHHRFLNLQHINWISKVYDKIKAGSYKLTAVQKYHFDAFFKTIENLNPYSIMNEHVSFYLNNTEEINSLITYREETRNYIVYQLEDVARQLNMQLCQTDNPRMRDLILPGLESELNCSMIFDNVFKTGNELRIVIGLASKNLHRVQELDQNFSADIDNTNLERNYNSGKGWHNYLTMRFKLTSDICMNLGSFIAERISSDLLPWAEKIGQYLKQTEPVSTSAL